jgi:hypothetical protein
MPNKEQVVLIHVIVRDGSGGQLLTVRRINRDTYLPPFGHDPRRMVDAVDGFDERYFYVGAVVYPPPELEGESTQPRRTRRRMVPLDE